MKPIAESLNTSALTASISDIAQINMKDVMPTGMLTKTFKPEDLLSSANTIGKRK